MRHLFNPEHDEISFHWSPNGFQIRLLNQSGDTFLIELDTEALDKMTCFILSAQGWHFEEVEHQPEPNDIPQDELPF